jgi:hypothetical protein
LVGVNESGKSNILAALSLLDDDTDMLPGDVREVHPAEDPVNESYIRFVFQFDKSERDAMYQAVKEVVWASNTREALVRFRGKRTTLRDFVNGRTEAFYLVDLIAKDRNAKAWSLGNPAEKLPGWKKPNAQCPSGYTIQTSSTESKLLKSFSLISEADTREIPPEYLDDGTLGDLARAVNLVLRTKINEERPTCLLWTYSAESVLPSRVSVSSFRANPDVCAPLKHMFALANVDHISEAFDRADETVPGRRNLLNRVADRATKHLHSVWKEHNEVSIRLAPNGEYIDIGIRDKHNEFDFARRSDGFKRFVTFLLMISARHRTDDLGDVIYLHDEPDLGLHPSGARYLRDELIRISKTNSVVFSTQSPFMIDRKLIRRHLITEKQAEITTVSEANESNVMDEEVLFNALGASLFESLKLRNIVFEGWRDKELFRIATARFPSNRTALRGVFNAVGVCHAQGAKDIKNLAPMLELADRKWIVVSDGDAPAREHQRLYKGDGPWLRYDELLGEPVVTAEDFIKRDVFTARVRELVKLHPELTDFAESDSDFDKGNLQAVKAWLNRNKIEPTAMKVMLDALKDQLFSNLKSSHIEDTYYDVLDALRTRLENL